MFNFLTICKFDHHAAPKCTNVFIARTVWYIDEVTVLLINIITNEFLFNKTVNILFTY